MNKSMLRNVDELRLKRVNIAGATTATVKRMDEIIKLYSERKISNRTTAPNPVDAMKITDVELVSEGGEKYNIITENFRDAVNLSIYHRYVHIPIAQKTDILKEAINEGNYADNECWIHLLTDYDADTIMHERACKRLTRERELLKS